MQMFFFLHVLGYVYWQLDTMIPLVLSFPCINSWRELFLHECLLYIQSGFETDLTELPKKTSELIWAQFF